LHKKERPEVDGPSIEIFEDVIKEKKVSEKGTVCFFATPVGF